MSARGKRFPIMERIQGLSEVNERGCWLWKGDKDPKGYARIKIEGKKKRAHKVAYETVYGPVPEGLQLDHFACDTKHCVNPDHVRPTTALENVLRSNNIGSRNAAKTHCPQGHPYTDENTYFTSDKRRRCRACLRERWRQERERKR